MKYWTILSTKNENIWCKFQNFTYSSRTAAVKSLSHHLIIPTSSDFSPQTTITEVVAWCNERAWRQWYHRNCNKIMCFMCLFGWMYVYQPHNEDLFIGQWSTVQVNIFSDMIIILELTSPLTEQNLFFTCLLWFASV